MKGRIAAFTLIELLTVMAIIVILAGLVLGTSGYVQKKAARSRAESEIAAMLAALENYKADNGIYPRDASTTDPLDAKTAVDPTQGSYRAASQRLYGQLSGDYDNTNPGASTNYNLKRDGNEKPGYMEFKPDMLNKDAAGTFVEYIKDPFGNSYGYSTAYQADYDVQSVKKPPGTVTKGYNPTYDLWSTGGQTTPAGSGQWIKNW